jgi:hypothetical protein
MLLKKIRNLDRQYAERFLVPLLDPFNKHGQNHCYDVYSNKNTNIANNNLIVLCPWRATKGSVAIT